MSSSTIQDAEAQHLLQHDPEDGYEMTTLHGETSAMGKDSRPGSASGKQSEYGEDAMSQEEGLLMGISEAGTLSTDPVYEAKARVLNHAVSPLFIHVTIELTRCRSKRLEWDGINGSSLSLLDLAGQTIICGRLSPPSSVR
jgi:hypothetical protein